MRRVSFLQAKLGRTAPGFWMGVGGFWAIEEQGNWVGSVYSTDRVFEEDAFAFSFGWRTEFCLQHRLQLPGSLFSSDEIN